jgi:ABC-type sugar transport system ATPase subunit
MNFAPAPSSGREDRVAIGRAILREAGALPASAALS